MIFILNLKKKSTKLDNFVEYLESHFDFEKINVKLEDIKEKDIISLQELVEAMYPSYEVDGIVAKIAKN